MAVAKINEQCSNCYALLSIRMRADDDAYTYGPARSLKEENIKRFFFFFFTTLWYRRTHERCPYRLYRLFRRNRQKNFRAIDKKSHDPTRTHDRAFKATPFQNAIIKELSRRPFLAIYISYSAVPHYSA